MKLRSGLIVDRGPITSPSVRPATENGRKTFPSTKQKHNSVRARKNKNNKKRNNSADDGGGGGEPPPSREKLALKLKRMNKRMKRMEKRHRKKLHKQMNSNQQVGSNNNGSERPSLNHWGGKETEGRRNKMSVPLRRALKGDLAALKALIKQEGEKSNKSLSHQLSHTFSLQAEDDEGNVYRTGRFATGFATFAPQLEFFWSGVGSEYRIRGMGQQFRFLRAIQETVRSAQVGGAGVEPEVISQWETLFKQKWFRAQQVLWNFCSEILAKTSLVRAEVIEEPLPPGAYAPPLPGSASGSNNQFSNNRYERFKKRLQEHLLEENHGFSQKNQICVGMATGIDMKPTNKDLESDPMDVVYYGNPQVHPKENPDIMPDIEFRKDPVPPESYPEAYKKILPSICLATGTFSCSVEIPGSQQKKLQYKVDGTVDASYRLSEDRLEARAVNCGLQLVKQNLCFVDPPPRRGNKFVVYCRNRSTICLMESNWVYGKCGGNFLGEVEACLRHLVKSGNEVVFQLLGVKQEPMT